MGACKLEAGFFFFFSVGFYLDTNISFSYFPPNFCTFVSVSSSLLSWLLMPSDALCFLQTGTLHSSCIPMVALRVICWLELRRDKALAFLKFLDESGTACCYYCYTSRIGFRNVLMSLNVAGILFACVKIVQSKMNAVLTMQANTFKSAF